MSEIISQNLKLRDISIITAEIKTLFVQAQNVALSYAIEIGRRLTEAKSVLPHGKWSEWLIENFEFSQSTANNFMKLFDEYGSNQSSLFGAVPNSQTFANLPYSKALQLLALPDEEREQFAKDNDIDKMSVRELKHAIDERNEANKRANELKTKLEDLQKVIDIYKEKISAAEKEALNNAMESDNAKKDIDKLSAELAAAEDKYNKLLKEKEKPKIPQKLIDEIKDKASSEAEKRFTDEKQKYILEADKKVAEALNQIEEARNTAVSYENKFKAAQKLNNPNITEFKIIFEQMQLLSNKLIDNFSKIKIDDAATGKKLSKAIEMFLQGLRNKLM